MSLKKPMIVAKFGGSSMADATCMRRSADVAAKSGAAITVVSATGGTTDQLVELARLASAGEEAQANTLCQKIIDRHLQIAEELNVSEECRSLQASFFAELKTLVQGMVLLKECSPKSMDSVYAIGERLSSSLFQQALAERWSGKEVVYLDIREVLKTDERHLRARPLLDQIKERAQEKILPGLEKGQVFVSQGFIGSTLKGVTTTLGRGGSDYSASLIGEAIGAESIEIWTDVAGIATTDPRICEQARMIKEISFQEAAQLATFGAKVLHPTTLQPAMRQQIPVFVGSSYDRELGGTWIRAEVEHTPLMRAMAIRSEQVILTITTPKMLEAHGFLARIFSLFDEHKVSVDSITTSEISVAITVHNSVLEETDLFDELARFAQVEIERDLSLVSLIGNHINHTPGLGQRVFNALQDGGEKINVRMICHGASRHNFCFLVKSEEAPVAVRRLHTKFIEEGPLA